MAKILMHPACINLNPHKRTAHWVTMRSRYGCVLVQRTRRHAHPRQGCYDGFARRFLLWPDVFTMRKQWYNMLANWWQEHLSPLQRLAWDSFAATHPITTEPGGPRTLNGFRFFMFTNNHLQPIPSVMLRLTFAPFQPFTQVPPVAWSAPTIALSDPNVRALSGPIDPGDATAIVASSTPLFPAGSGNVLAYFS